MIMSYTSKMMKFAFFIFFSFFLLFHEKCHGLSCYAGETGCKAACQYQNCALGYCNFEYMCICSDCDSYNETVSFTETITSYSANFGRKRVTTHNVGLADGVIRFSILENGRTFEVCLTAVGDLDDHTIVLRVGTIADTATAKEDFLPMIDNTYLLFNETKKDDQCFDVVIFDDELEEKNENFTLTLSVPLREASEPQLINLNTIKPIVVNIIDNDYSNSNGATCFKPAKFYQLITIAFAVLAVLTTSNLYQLLSF